MEQAKVRALPLPLFPFSCIRVRTTFPPALARHVSFVCFRKKERNEVRDQTRQTTRDQPAERLISHLRTLMHLEFAMHFARSFNTPEQALAILFYHNNPVTHVNAALRLVCLKYGLLSLSLSWMGLDFSVFQNGFRAQGWVFNKIFLNVFNRCSCSTVQQMFNKSCSRLLEHPTLFERDT